MLLVDVHAHLDQESSEDLAGILERAASSGIRCIIANGTGPLSNRKVLELSRKHKIISPALGLYPTDAAILSEEEVKAELEFIRTSQPIALGEVGLDLHHSQDNLERQKKAFELVIRLAGSMAKPLIVHSRKAEEECIDMLKGHRGKVIMHCFGGKKRLVREVIKNGWFFSIPASVEYDMHFQNIVRMTPLKQLLSETDSPYLGPVRGEKNEPANVRVSIEKIAQIKGVTAEEAANMVYMNYQGIF